MARNDTTTEPNSLARNDAYTGMLIVSLLALLAGGVLLFVDYNQYPDKSPPKVVKVVPEAPTGTTVDGGGPEQKKDEGAKPAKK